ncbi:McrC family protein [Treponema sp.]|uniref:McrC family protein n=1 Tax=Treponema sp. TaxID=166 RepID=UPI003F02A95E
MSLVLLNDNSNEEKSLSVQECKNLGEIAGKTIDELKILVFPPSAEKTVDKIADSVIFYMSESGGKVVLKTGNIMGFVGCGGTEVNICSRFTENGKGDFFLHYMLEKVCHINIAKLESSRVRDRIFDFLPFLFPKYLFDALGQGLYKEYQTHEYNDSNVRGVIDINRHIRLNVPANGKIAYRAREYSYDNPVMQLVRHTIEYMRADGLFKYILSSSEKMKEAVAVIDSATLSYNRMERNKILSKTAKAIKSPYFFKYRSLQKICRMILLREKIKYDSSADKIYGILFDGAWLWEEYLATILKDVGYVHAENKTDKNPIYLWSGNPRYPDFYKGKQNPNFTYGDEIPEENCILDAKYKPLGNHSVRREDVHQIVTYMHILPAKRAGLIYPHKPNDEDFSAVPKSYTVKGMGGTLSVFGVKIPQNAENYQDFKAQMKSEEERLVRIL